MRRTVPTSTLLALAALAGAMEPAAATPVIKPTVVAGEQSIALDTPDLTNVAKGRFYVSADQGRTWNLAQEIAVDLATKKAPVFVFKPAADGAYYIVTATVAKSGAAEPAPANGSVPGKALLLVVDSTPPVVSALDAVATPVTDPNATTVDLTVTWTIADANFASATLDTSSDGGASFITAQAIAATGSAKLTVPRTKDNTVQIRIVAKDAAGNQAPSLAKSIALPVPPDPEKALDAAVKSLPTLAEVQPLPDKPVTAAPAASEAKPAETAGTADAPATTNASASTAPATADAAVKPGTEEAAATAATGEAKDIEAKPDVQVKPLPVTERPIQPPAQTTFLASPGAEEQLAKARELRAAKNTDGAHAIYLRLQDSAVAKVAVAEDLAMLYATGDHPAVVALADALRTELRTDTARLIQGKSLLAVGHAAEAEQTLLKVRKGSDEAREALLYIGKAAFAQGKIAISTRIYEKLAQGDDEIAAEAKLLRGK